MLVLMMEAYAEVVGVPLDQIKRWVEKTPANRNYVPEIFHRFPKAKLLLTMRDPRALEALGRAALDANVLVASSASDALAAYESKAALPYLLRATAAPSRAKHLIGNPSLP